MSEITTIAIYYLLFVIALVLGGESGEAAGRNRRYRFRVPLVVLWLSFRIDSIPS